MGATSKYSPDIASGTNFAGIFNAQTLAIVVAVVVGVVVLSCVAAYLYRRITGEDTKNKLPALPIYNNQDLDWSENQRGRNESVYAMDPLHVPRSLSIDNTGQPTGIDTSPR